MRFKQDKPLRRLQSPYFSFLG